MRYLAVIDTNVIVSALITKDDNASTRTIMRYVMSGMIKPLYHPDILREYADVLCRDKFGLHSHTIDTVISAIKQFGIEVNPIPTGTVLVDMDDLIFYDVVSTTQKYNSYLVTGNTKHYPNRSFIVTPSEMVDIINIDLR